MDIERLLRDHNIPYAAMGHPHCTDGWVNVHCPFCPGSQDYHLGINREHPVSHCWRCGGHSTIEALSRILNLPTPEIRRIIERYDGGGAIKAVAEPRVAIHPFKMPQPHSFWLNAHGKGYLTRRVFDPDHLQRLWQLKQTGPISYLDGISYSNRILIPIFWNGKVVSFQSRDITGISDRKYLACPMRREITHHKYIVYGKQDCWGDSLIIVEGVTDVWRLGTDAVATFGTSFTMDQVLQLSRVCGRFFILFDNEPQAQDQARKLATKLRVLGNVAYIETVKGDPGDMRQDDADHLVRQLIKRGKTS